MTTPLLQEDKAADDAGRDAGRIAELRKEVEMTENRVFKIARILASIIALAALLTVFYRVSAWILSTTSSLTNMKSCVNPVAPFSHIRCFFEIMYFWYVGIASVFAVFMFVINPIRSFVRSSLRYCRNKRELARLLREQERQEGEGEKGEGVGV